MSKEKPKDPSQGNAGREASALGQPPAAPDDLKALIQRVGKLETDSLLCVPRMTNTENDLKALETKANTSNTQLAIIDQRLNALQHFLNGAKWMIVAFIPIAGALIAFVGYDYTKVRTDFNRFSDSIPEFERKAHTLSNTTAGLQLRVDALQDRLLGEIKEAERLAGNNWGVFIGPFADYDHATHFVRSHSLDAKKYKVIRSFERKGDYLVVSTEIQKVSTRMTKHSSQKPSPN